MCTLTWRAGESGVEIAFSRDERRTRSAATPPSRRERDGVAYLAPTDGDAGGTWIATNACATTVCLLNAYHCDDVPEPAGGWRSRGGLVLDAADAAGAADVARRLCATDLSRVRPFSLAAFDAARGPFLFEWDGRALADRGLVVEPPIVSSSFEPDAVRASRVELFRRTAARLGALDDYHASHDPEPGPFSVCMHRDDASTVSLSVVTVGRDATTFRYRAGAPCDESAAVFETTLNHALGRPCFS